VVECPSCRERLAMQGNIWIVEGNPVTAGFCYNQDCPLSGNTIIFKLMEEKEVKQ